MTAWREGIGVEKEQDFAARSCGPGVHERGAGGDGGPQEPGPVRHGALGALGVAGSHHDDLCPLDAYESVHVVKRSTEGGSVVPNRNDDGDTRGHRVIRIASSHRAIVSVPSNLCCFRKAIATLLDPVGVEDGDDRHAVHDLARENHPKNFLKAEGPDLDELRLIGREGELHHLLA